MLFHTSNENLSKPRSRLRKALVGVLLTAVSAAVIWIAIPRNGLISSAVLLVSKEHWVGPERHNGDIQNYDWLTDTEVLIYRKNADKTVSLLRKRVVPDGETTPIVEMRLPRLHDTFGVVVSPDRESLEVLHQWRGVPRRRRMTSELISIKDGKRYGPVSNWLLGTYDPVHNAVCDCQFNKELTAELATFDSNKPREIRITGLKNPGVMVGNVWPLFIEPSGRVLACGDSYYCGIVTPDEIVKLGSKLSPVRSFVEFNLNHPDTPGKTWTVPVPADAATFNCDVSPRHDRILWSVQSNRMTAFTQLSQHLPKSMRLKPRYLARWMVSDLAGNNMHTIAQYEISDLYFNRPDLIFPKWMPDGKHVSFEYQGALYMTNAGS